MSENHFTPIGHLVGPIVARSTLATVSEDWQAITVSDDAWVVYISLQQGKLLLVHCRSQTYSEPHFNEKNVITKQDVFVTDRDEQRCEDGYWIREHGQMAEHVLRFAGHRISS